MRAPRHSAWPVLVPLALVVLATLLVYGPTLNGFWLGDDLSNLYRAWTLDREGRLLEGTLAFFTAPVDAVGAFYRPLMMASLSLSYALFGLAYPGWAALSLGVHLVGAALVYALVRRLAPDRPPTGALLAAALFALNPLPVEAVTWVSARADGWVTLLTLAAAWLWAGAGARTGRGAWKAAAGVVLLLTLALGFKESAVIFPLQLAVLAVFWPRPLGAPRWTSLLIALVVAGAFLALRLEVTGSAVEAYRGSMARGLAPESLVSWWMAYFEGQRILATLFTAGSLGIVLLALRPRGLRAHRMALAALLAAGGLVAATVLNLGGLSPAGEGGRLFHTPLAWFCVGVGLLVATLPAGSKRQRLGQGLAAAAVLLALPLVAAHVGQVRDAQAQLRAFVDAVPSIAEAHPGLALILVPDRVGSVITARNGDGALVLPPLQDRPLLHRVLPTMDRGTGRRFVELQGGLASQLRAQPPRDAGAETIARLLQPAPAQPPEWVGCWDGPAGIARIQPWPESLSWPDPATWRALMAEIASTCGLFSESAD